MSVLEAVSYTRKDGQYLRWDYRSGRALRARVNKGPILSFAQALGERLFEMDMGPLEFGGASPEFLTGSSLELLRSLPDLLRYGHDVPTLCSVRLHPDVRP